MEGFEMIVGGAGKGGKLESLKKSDKKVYELISKKAGGLVSCGGYHEGLLDVLRSGDGAVYGLIVREYERLRDTIQLIAAENICSRAVLAAIGSVVQNKTVEGFAGARFHGGSEVVDEIESLAAARACESQGRFVGTIMESAVIR